MTAGAILAFAAAFFLLAVSPGPGLAAILSRALSGGIVAGYAVMFGLVVGDAIFLAVAMAGLSAIAAALGPMFSVVKYAGAAYLVWLGIQALRSQQKVIELTAASPTSLAKDFGLGLLVTLGNPKPIIFYGALLPTFLDLATVSIGDFAMLMVVVLVISCLVYGVYMQLMERAQRMLRASRAAKRLNQATGAMLTGSGVAVAIR